MVFRLNVLFLFQGYGAGQRVPQPLGVSFAFLSTSCHIFPLIFLIIQPLSSSLSYERVDEIIWVKTNQLQRIIRTGRTGHWLNHGKEHCLVGLNQSQCYTVRTVPLGFGLEEFNLQQLFAFVVLNRPVAEIAEPVLSHSKRVCLQVGVKGNPQGFNRGLDCDVIVAEVNSCKSSVIRGVITHNSFSLSHVCALSGPLHESQARRDLRHDRETLTRHQEDWALWSTPQCPA